MSHHHSSLQTCVYILPNMATVRHPASCISDKPGPQRGEDYIPDRWYTLASSKNIRLPWTHISQEQAFPNFAKKKVKSQVQDALKITYACKVIIIHICALSYHIFGVVCANYLHNSSLRTVGNV